MPYTCKIASLAEMHRRWDDELALHPGELNWSVWKDEAIARFLSGRSVPYYGLLDGAVICEATAVPDPAFAPADGLRAVELCAFRTVAAYRGQGYFSALMAFLLRDLKEKGFGRAIVGVEPQETRNRAIYRHWGFTDPAGRSTETYPDGTVIEVEFWAKVL